MPHWLSAKQQGKLSLLSGLEDSFVAKHLYDLDSESDSSDLHNKVLTVQPDAVPLLLEVYAIRKPASAQSAHAYLTDLSMAVALRFIINNADNNKVFLDVPVLP